LLSSYAKLTKSACRSPSGENAWRFATAFLISGGVVSSKIRFGSRIVWCSRARWISAW
jgi:hypothetical protein